MNHEEPTLPAATVGEPPEGLLGAGLSEWKRVGKLLEESGALKETDLGALEDMCRCLSELRVMETKARKAGPELAIAKGYQGMVLKLRSQLNLLRRELGMTPSSRTGVKVAKGQVPAKDDKVARYLRALPGGRA